MTDIVGTLLTTSRRPLATSAMPDAPVVDDAHHWARQAIGAAVQVLGRGSRRLAARVELTVKGMPRRPTHDTGDAPC